MDELQEVDRKHALLRERARDARVKLKLHEAHGSWLEGVLGRGDRSLAEVIETAYHKGARFDGWDEHLRFELWREAMAEHAVDPQPFLGTIPVTGRLPWDHLDVGLEPGFLLKEYRKALQGRLSPPCGKPFQAQVHHTNLEDARADRRKLVCYDCGVACDLERMREERIEFLTALGAEKPRPPAPEVLPREEKGPRRKREPKVRFKQGEPTYYRLAYTKLGRMAFTGHLDMVRTLPRLLRRAGLTVYYSQGFHPHPVLSYGPALSLGIASLCEYVDFALNESPDPATLLRRLRAVAQDGMELTGILRLRPGDPHIGKAVAVVDYMVALRPGELPDGVSVPERIAVERKGKETREVGLREAVLLARRVESDRVPAALELGAGGGALYLRLAAAGGGVRPTEAARAILGRAVEPVEMARVGMWTRELRSPLGGPAEAPVLAETGVLQPVQVPLASRG